MNPELIVVGSGNAAFCAALAAQERGVAVLMLEAAPESEFGGNSRYTAGAMRFAYTDHNDIVSLLADTTDPRLERTDFGTYPVAQFQADLLDFNGGRALSTQQAMLINESHALMRWLKDLGVDFAPIYSRQAFERDDKFQFWGGLTLNVVGEGDGLIQTQRDAFLSGGGAIRYDCSVRELIYRDDRICGVSATTAKSAAEQEDFFAAAVVLACGGFEANAAARSERLGQHWQHAKVRGTRYNQGHGMTMAQAAGAAVAGKFDGCHATPMDAAMPDYGNPEMPHIHRKNYRKISYPFGVMLNARGERFVDEGKNFRNYTYAQYGRAILEQPHQRAWQFFDAQAMEFLYEEYRVDFASKFVAPTLEDLIGQLEGIDRTAALSTLAHYNDAVNDAVGFDPTALDGRCTQGLAINKTNWALRLEQPPFYAYPVVCGITFTYGGLAVSVDGEVLSDRETGNAIAGLYAAGELVGELFFDGYPGGSGLTAGGVFGRAAGYAAAAFIGR